MRLLRMESPAIKHTPETLLKQMSELDCSHHHLMDI
jgi:hypothetical protein